MQTLLRVRCCNAVSFSIAARPLQHWRFSYGLCFMPLGDRVRKSHVPDTASIASVSVLQGQATAKGSSAAQAAQGKAAEAAGFRSGDASAPVFIFGDNANERCSACEPQ